MSSHPLRVAYFGLPLGALALHQTLQQTGASLCVVALGHADAPGARRVRRKLSGRALLLAKPDLEAPEVVRTLRSAAPDVIFSWFWPRLIPQEVLDLAPLGAFGVHPSLLPQWRGPDPYFWALASGDTHTGVSLHRLSAEYDRGNIVSQMRLPILPGYNAWTLAKALDKPSLRLLVAAAEALIDGQTLEGVAQDDALGTEAPQPSDEQLVLRFHVPAEQVVRQIRALAPHPGAATTLGDEPVEVLEASCFERALPKVLEPGNAVLCSKGVVICAGTGGVVLNRVRLGDGSTLSGFQIAELFPSGLFNLPGERHEKQR